MEIVHKTGLSSISSFSGVYQGGWGYQIARWVIENPQKQFIVVCSGTKEQERTLENLMTALSVLDKSSTLPRSETAEFFPSWEVLPHEKFQRNGKNLHHDHYISFVDAALGSTAEVPLLGGKAKIKVDAGTQSGKIVRLRGKGLPSVDSYGKGDLLVNLNVWTPQELSSEERDILEKWREAPNFQPDPDPREKGFFERVRDMFS